MVALESKILEVLKNLKRISEKRLDSRKVLHYTGGEMEVDNFFNTYLSE